MASQYIVKRNTYGCYDLWMRDLISVGEYARRFQHMVGECGFTEDEAARELYLMVCQFFKKTTTPTGVPLPLCEKYIFDTIDPGDIISIDNSLFVVNLPAAA